MSVKNNNDGGENEEFSFIIDSEEIENTTVQEQLEKAATENIDEEEITDMADEENISDVDKESLREILKTKLSLEIEHNKKMYRNLMSMRMNELRNDDKNWYKVNEEEDENMSEEEAKEILDKMIKKQLNVFLDNYVSKLVEPSDPEKNYHDQIKTAKDISRQLIAVETLRVLISESAEEVAQRIQEVKHDILTFTSPEELAEALEVVMCAVFGI